jgi:hypothetical protein
MISKTITSVAIIIAVAAMFISSSTIVNSVLAKTTTSTKVSSSKDKGTSSSDTGDKGTSSSDTGDKGTSSSDTGDKGTSSSDKSSSVEEKGTSSSDKSSSSTAEQDYKDFQKCLSDAEGTNGFATKSEIKSCFNPIYLPATTTTTTPINADPTAFNN